MEIPSHDGNGEGLSGIAEEKVEAIVHLVVVCLVIESMDVSRCNMASSWDLSKSIESNKQEGGSQRDGENTLKECGNMNVPDLVSSPIVLNYHLSFSTSTADL